MKLENLSMRLCHLSFVLLSLQPPPQRMFVNFQLLNHFPFLGWMDSWNDLLDEVLLQDLGSLLWTNMIGKLNSSSWLLIKSTTEPFFWHFKHIYLICCVTKIIEASDMDRKAFGFQTDHAFQNKITLIIIKRINSVRIFISDMKWLYDSTRPCMNMK